MVVKETLPEIPSKWRRILPSKFIDLYVNPRELKARLGEIAKPVTDIFRGYTDQELASARDITSGNYKPTDEERAAFIKGKIDALSSATFQAPKYNAIGGSTVFFPMPGYHDAVKKLQSLTPTEIDGLIKQEAEDLLERTKKKPKK
ncbi:hypothetical protein C4559_05260 [Candidatus Microgenomates bacterium]|nr:MAG: hypothetical protein C4559_05260 [Candidatus Microgenomates bacterium]